MAKSGRSGIDLTEGPVFSTLISFSYPIVLTNLLHTAYNLIDMAIVGNFTGSIGLTAVSVVSDILNVILLASNGFSNAAQIIVSQYMGVKDRVSVNKSAGTIFSTVTLFSLALTAVMILFNAPILRAMNVPEEAWSEAVRYAITCYVGIVFTFGYGLLSSILRGMGDSRHPLLFIGVASVLNIVLDILFVGPMHMGAFGAALATVIAQGFSFLWSLSYIYRRREDFGFDISWDMFRIERKMLTRYIRLSVPMSLQKSFIQLANVYINSFIYAYGVTAAAVTGIGTKLGNLAQIFSSGMLQGGAAMIGQNISAGKTERVKKVFYINSLYAACVWCVFAGVTVAFRTQIFSIFTSDLLVIEMSAVFLPALLLRYLMFCQRCPFMALINGVGNPRFNYILGILDGLVLRIGSALLMGIVLKMGLRGFWYGNALGGFGPTLVGSVYFFSGMWKRDKLIIKD